MTPSTPTSDPVLDLACLTTTYFQADQYTRPGLAMKGMELVPHVLAEVVSGVGGHVELPAPGIMPIVTARVSRNHREWREDRPV